jgi:2-polyprenyl-6-methoxyphenol hydroxylase-like FAD-dependent oxidoreductase
LVLADLPVSGLSREAWETWPHPTDLVSLYPLPSTDLFQYAASIAPGAEPRLGLADLQATLEDRTGRTNIRLHEPQWTSVWRANIRLVDHYRIGSVFLAGDAAPIHSPAGGQGMNTGIQDAHNLAWKFAAVVNEVPRSPCSTVRGRAPTRRRPRTGPLQCATGHVHPDPCRPGAAGREHHPGRRRTPRVGAGPRRPA